MGKKRKNSLGTKKELVIEHALSFIWKESQRDDELKVTDSELLGLIQNILIDYGYEYSANTQERLVREVKRNLPKELIAVELEIH